MRYNKSVIRGRTIHVEIWSRTGPFVRLSVHPSVRPSVHSFVHTSVCPTVVPSIRPSTRTSVRSSFHLSVRLFVRPSVYSFVLRPFVEPSVNPSDRPSVRPSTLPYIPSGVRKFVCPSAHQSVRSSFRPSVRLSIYQSVPFACPPEVLGSQSVCLSVRPSVGPSARPSVLPSVRLPTSTYKVLRPYTYPSVRPPSVRRYRSIRSDVRPDLLSLYGVSASAPLTCRRSGNYFFSLMQNWCRLVDGDVHERSAAGRRALVGGRTDGRLRVAGGQARCSWHERP